MMIYIRGPTYFFFGNLTLGQKITLFFEFQSETFSMTDVGAHCSTRCDDTSIISQTVGDDKTLQRGSLHAIVVVYS